MQHVAIGLAQRVRQNAVAVLCGRESASYRRFDLKAQCDFPGYRTAQSVNGFDILLPASSGSVTPPMFPLLLNERTDVVHE